MKHIGIFPDNPRLPRKIVLVFVATMSTIVLLFGIYLFLSIRTRYRSELEQSVVRRVQQRGFLVEGAIESITNAAQLVAGDSNLIVYLNRTETPTARELIQFRDSTVFYIENIININPMIEDLYVYTDNINTVSVRSVIRSDPTIMGLQWVSDFYESEFFGKWSLPGDSDVVSQGGGLEDNHSVRYIAKVPGYDAVPSGIVVVGVPFDDFLGVYETPVQPDSAVALYRNGTFYRTENDGSAELHGVMDQIRIDLDDGGGVDTGVRRVSADGVSTIVAYVRVDDLDAYIVEAVGFTAFAPAIRTVTTAIVIGIALFIVAVSIIIRTFVFHTLRRLQTMTEAMRRIEAGDWHLTMDTGGDDELAELSRHFQGMVDKVNELIDTVVEKQLSARNAHLKAFFSQINAHFLYNTLENLKMVAEIRGELDLSDALTSLGRFFRYNVDWKRPFVPLSEEIRHVGDYLRIVNLRRDEPIQLNVEIDKEFEVPKMILQPVVENSVVHGFDRTQKDARIDVGVVVESGIVHIRIVDNGIGISEPARLRLENALRTAERDEGEHQYVNGTEIGDDSGIDEASASVGIGLSNVHRRLRLLYGSAAGVRVRDTRTGGVVVELALNREE